MELIGILKWPLVVMVLLLVFGRAIIRLVAKYGRVRLKSKAIELTLEKLKEEDKVSKTQVEKLHGLTGHDLWALSSFVRQPDDSFKYVETLSPQRKAIVYSFIEMGLLEVVGEGPGRYLQPTELAVEVLAAADKLL